MEGDGETPACRQAGFGRKNRGLRVTDYRGRAFGCGSAALCPPVSQWCDSATVLLSVNKQLELLWIPLPSRFRYALRQPRTRALNRAFNCFNISQIALV